MVFQHHSRREGHGAQERLLTLLDSFTRETAARTVGATHPHLLAEIDRAASIADAGYWNAHDASVLIERLPHAARFYASSPERSNQALAVLLHDLRRRVERNAPICALTAEAVTHRTPMIPARPVCAPSIP